MFGHDKCSEQNEIKDDESISNKCWLESYKGDSRKWLIRDETHRKTGEPVCSTMKSTYRYQVFDETPTSGRRRALLLKQLEEEAAAEVIRERNLSQPVEKYCTEYDGNFNVAGLKPKEDSNDRRQKLYEKYPLYASVPTTFYSHCVKERPGETLHGLTRVINPTKPFRKCVGFTKPLSEVLDTGC